VTFSLTLRPSLRKPRRPFSTLSKSPATTTSFSPLVHVEPFPPVFGLARTLFSWGQKVDGRTAINAAADHVHASQEGSAASPGLPKLQRGEKDMNRKYFQLLSAGLFLLLAIASLPALGQKSLEIPSGTSIRVRMIDNLSSEKAQVGDTFRGTLDEAIQVNGRELYPKGADVIGRITDVHTTGRLSEPGELDLVLNTVSSGTVATSINVEPLVIKGESHAKSNATKIGGGAVLGAVIGAIAGGGKGAAIGTVAGGAAGTGAAAATGKKPAIVDSEAVLTFVTSSASTPATAPPPPPAASSNDAPAPAPAPPPSDPASTSDPATPDDNTPLFTLRDRRTIRSCVNEHASDLPAATTQRPELPSGSERQIHRGGSLPSEIQNRLSLCL